MSDCGLDGADQRPIRYSLDYVRDRDFDDACA
jgi:hypothetical protein